MSAAAAPARADRANPLSAAFWVGQLDLRPLALFRIVFALFIAYDLLDLLPNVVTFFSDAGVMPRHALLAENARWNRFSLSDTVGAPEAVYLYWILAFTACMCVVFGYRTRIAQFALYLFVAGFNERLPELFDGSDSVIRLTLFWLCFCPSGNRYSVDAVRAQNRGEPRPETGLALPVRLIQAQIAWVYLCSFLHKTGGWMWHDGTALHYVLHINHVFARPWAAAVADNATMMAVGTWFAMALEASFALLVFSPIQNRRTKALALLGGTALHGGIALTVNVGLFSYLMPLTYFVFFEPEWTEWALDRLRSLCGRGKTTVIFDGNCAGCVRTASTLGQLDRFGNLTLLDFRKEPLPAAAKELKPKDLDGALHAIKPDGTVLEGYWALSRIYDRLPATFLVSRLMRLPVVAQIAAALYRPIAEYRHASARIAPPAPKVRPLLFSERWRRTLRDVGYGLVAALFVSTAWYAAPQPGRGYLPLWAERTVQWCSLWNVWDMFSPNPLNADYHLRAVGEYSDGTTEDLFGGPADGPGEVRGFWFTRWWKYLETVAADPVSRPVFPREWGNWQCRNHSWNQGPGGKRLWQVTLKKEVQRIPPIGQPWPPVINLDIWNWRCFEKRPAPAQSQAMPPELATPANELPRPMPMPIGQRRVAP